MDSRRLDALRAFPKYNAIQYVYFFLLLCRIEHVIASENAIHLSSRKKKASLTPKCIYKNKSSFAELYVVGHSLFCAQQRGKFETAYLNGTFLAGGDYIYNATACKDLVCCRTEK